MLPLEGVTVVALEQRGAVFVDELADVPDGATVVFSAHGVSPAVRTEAEHRGLDVIDATCPLVTKVHNEARRFAVGGVRPAVERVAQEVDTRIRIVGGQGHRGGIHVVPLRVLGTRELHGDFGWCGVFGVVLLLIIAHFTYFYPVLAAYPLDESIWRERLWFDVWIYGSGGP